MNRTAIERAPLLLRRALEHHKKIKKIIAHEIFKKFIIPIVKRSNYTIDWAMGGVDFTAPSGKVLNQQGKLYTNLEKDITMILDEVNINDDKNHHNPLWWVMSTIQYAGSFTLAGGLKTYEERKL